MIKDTAVEAAAAAVTEDGKEKKEDGEENDNDQENDDEDDIGDDPYKLGLLSKPPKILALLDAIRAMKEDEKGVIFSQL